VLFEIKRREETRRYPTPTIGVSDGIVQDAIEPWEEPVFVPQCRGSPDRFQKTLLQQILRQLGRRDLPADMCQEALSVGEKSLNEMIVGHAARYEEGVHHAMHIGPSQQEALL